MNLFFCLCIKILVNYSCIYFQIVVRLHKDPMFPAGSIREAEGEELWTRTSPLLCSALDARQTAASRYSLWWRQFPSCVEEFLRKPNVPWIFISSHHSISSALSNARSDLASKAFVNGREGSPRLPLMLFLPFPLQWCHPQSQQAEDVPMPPDVRTVSLWESQLPPHDGTCLSTCTGVRRLPGSHELHETQVSDKGQ